MKYALVNNVRKEAEPRSTGSCPCCGADVRAYCGKQVIHHWKHINKEQCDSWLEGETQWHRDWKNNFEILQQEVVKRDSTTGEKHIADVYIESKDLVIEFQHSPIHFDEIKAREAFYKRMIWVVDVAPYKKNIKLHEDIRSNFSDIINLPSWANSFEETEKRLKKVDKKQNEISEDEYIIELKKKYNPFVMDILSKIELEYFSESNDPEKFNVFYEVEEYRRNRINKKNHYLMQWNHQHKRWNETNLPMFLDLGDDYIYLVKDLIKVANGFIVKRYSKKEFLNHYQ